MSAELRRRELSLSDCRAQLTSREEELAAAHAEQATLRQVSEVVPGLIRPDWHSLGWQLRNVCIMATAT
jgi:hypothetical protein